MNICHVGVLHNKSLFEKYGFFDERYIVAGDYEFLMRVGYRLSSSDFDRVVAHCGNFGVSRSMIRKAFWEAISIHKIYKSNYIILSLLRYTASYFRLRLKLLFS